MPAALPSMTKEDSQNFCLCDIDPMSRAYNDAEIGLPKQDVDETISSWEADAAGQEENRACVSLGTHDVALIRRLADCASTRALRKKILKCRCCNGIQRTEQERLAVKADSIVLVATAAIVRGSWAAGGTAGKLWFMLRTFSRGSCIRI